jgi:hypothetical protein
MLILLFNILFESLLYPAVAGQVNTVYAMIYIINVNFII